MSTDNASPPEKKQPFYRRILPKTVAGKSALVTFFVLALMLAIVWTLRLFSDDSVQVSHAMSAGRIAIELILVFLIPIILYWGIRRWNQVVDGEFPDIDRAWEAGIEALQAKGISPDDYPIFLVLGSSGPSIEMGLMEALGTNLNIHGVPDASEVNHALQWYMTTDAIYLFCPEASSLSSLMGRWTPDSAKRRVRRQPASAPSGAEPAASQSSDGSAAHSAAALAGTAKALAAPLRLPRVPKPVAPRMPSAVRAIAPKGLDAGSLTKMAAGSGGGTAAAPDASATDPASGAAPTGPTPSLRPSPLAPVPGATGGSGPPPETGPDTYTGTIQHNSLDMGPARSSPPPAPAGNSPFNMPAASAASPASGPSLSPVAPEAAGGKSNGSVPPHQGTIMFDQYPSSAPTPGSAAPTPGSAAGRPSRSSTSPAPAPVGPLQSRAPSAVGSQNSGGTAAAPIGGSTHTPPAERKGPEAGGMPLLSSNKKVALPPSLDTSDQLPRLRYVCKLLKRFRRPTCGINGIVTLIPFELSGVGPLQLAAIAQSARDDVDTVQQTMGIRAPVTAVLIGMEQDKGFIELVRRLQAGFLSRRLGGRFDLRSRPTPSELNTHSDRLCDAFEDWVYRLFSREDGLEQQRGNRKLYALTSKIRHELKPRLRIVLGQAFGCQSSDGDSIEQDESFFFSGCYFAATGAATGQPAFVRGVLHDKLLDEQSKVQWTREAERKHRWMRILAVVGWILAILLAIAVLIKTFPGNG